MVYCYGSLGRLIRCSKTTAGLGSLENDQRTPSAKEEIDQRPIEGGTELGQKKHGEMR